MQLVKLSVGSLHCSAQSKKYSHTQVKTSGVMDSAGAFENVLENDTTVDYTKKKIAPSFS